VTGNAGTTLGEIAAQMVTSGEHELTKFAVYCIRSVVHSSALQPYKSLSNSQPKLELIYQPQKVERLSWPE